MFRFSPTRYQLLDVSFHFRSICYIKMGKYMYLLSAVTLLIRKRVNYGYTRSSCSCT